MFKLKTAMEFSSFWNLFSCEIETFYNNHHGASYFLFRQEFNFIGEEICQPHYKIISNIILDDIDYGFNVIKISFLAKSLLIL